MKIDGMDATSNSFSLSIKPIETVTPTKETSREGAISNEKNKSDINLDTVAISQITLTDKREMPVSEKVVIDAIERANKAISGGNRRFEFSIHEKTKEIIVKVIDSDSGKVVREIPSEKTLDLVAKLWEMSGLMVDERR